MLSMRGMPRMGGMKKISMGMPKLGGLGSAERGLGMRRPRLRSGGRVKSGR